MNGSLLGDAGKELAQRAIETLSGWGLALSPQNYELAVAYLSGERRDIVSAVDAAIEGGAPSQVALDAIANECLKNGKVSEAVEKTGGRLSEELAAVMTRLEEAGRNTAAYGQALAGAKDRMDDGEDPIQLKAMINALADATHKMQRHSETLESQLAETKQEVSQLRTNLDIVREQAQTDALTGLANRKRMDEALDQAIRQADITGEPLAVSVCDIDHFKRFNDTWGHQTGDQIIKFVASCLKRCAGERNLVARYGGEEFVMIMPDTPLEDAADIAERVRSMVESKRLLRKSTSEDLGGITISIGCAQHVAGEGATKVIERADALLYESKRNGRNQVTVQPMESAASQAA